MFRRSFDSRRHRFSYLCFLLNSLNHLWLLFLKLLLIPKLFLFYRFWGRMLWTFRRLFWWGFLWRLLWWFSRRMLWTCWFLSNDRIKILIKYLDIIVLTLYLRTVFSFSSFHLFLIIQFIFNQLFIIMAFFFWIFILN